jgi:hypothetical protein
MPEEGKKTHRLLALGDLSFLDGANLDYNKSIPFKFIGSFRNSLAA